MTKLKVVFSQIFYPLSIGRYLEAALDRRKDIEVYKVGPFSGDWIPWGGGMHLPAKYATPPDLPLPMSNAPIPVSFVERKLPWTPDAWIQVDAGFHFQHKPASGLNFIIGTDPHVLNYEQQRILCDKFFCMQAHYAEAGDEYLPYAFDPIYHCPEEQPRNYDVCLLGLHYNQRNQLVEALRERGVKVMYDLGPVYDEARGLYNQAPIGLNWSSLKDLTARVFELLGMKRLAVVNEVPDLSRFFENGRDLVVFQTLEQAVEKVMYYLAHPDETEAIAEQGHQTAQPHTWDARIEQVLSYV